MSDFQIPDQNPEMYPINPPIEEPQPTIIYTQFQITTIEIILNTKANIRVILFSEDRTRCQDKYLVMEGEDYALWGDQDNYVYLWVCNQLGIAPSL